MSHHTKLWNESATVCSRYAKFLSTWVRMPLPSAGDSLHEEILLAILVELGVLVRGRGYSGCIMKDVEEPWVVDTSS